MTATPPEARGRRWARVLAVAYLALAAGTVVAAVSLWRTRCEGFGCTGLGIAWAMWAGLYVPTVALGAWAWRLSRAQVRLMRVVGGVLALQLSLGLALFGYWAFDQWSGR